MQDLTLSRRKDEKLSLIEMTMKKKRIGKEIRLKQEKENPGRDQRRDGKVF